MRKWKFALDNPCKPLLNVCGNFPCVNVSWNLYNIGQLHDGVTLFLLQEFLATHRVQIKSVKEVLKSCEATESFGVVLFLTGITGCLPFTKSFPENPAGNQMEHCFRVVPAENFRERRNIWKGGPVSFLDGIFPTEIRVPFLQSRLWYQFQTFAVFAVIELIGRKFTSPEFCLPFAQTMDPLVCPCKWQTTTKFKYQRKNEMKSGFSSKKASSCKWPNNLLNKLLQINNTNTV